MYKVLFVCMGNICRSPSAEGFFSHHLKSSRVRTLAATDSAGTHSYHIGSPPDSRAIGMASEWQVDISGLNVDAAARRVKLAVETTYRKVAGHRSSEQPVSGDVGNLGGASRKADRRRA